MKEEITKSSELVYDGKLIKLTYDIATIEGKKEVWREVAHHPGASAVLVVDENNRIVMERQYRYAIGTTLLEIPAGKLDKDEDPLVCAKRELEEETGLKAADWTFLGTIATSAGFCNEVIHLFLAKNLSKGQTNWDDDEYVELEYYTLPELMEALRNEKIKDTKTLSAITLALPYLEEGSEEGRN